MSRLEVAETAEWETFFSSLTWPGVIFKYSRLCTLLTHLKNNCSKTMTLMKMNENMLREKRTILCQHLLHFMFLMKMFPMQKVFLNSSTWTFLNLFWFCSHQRYPDRDTLGRVTMWTKMFQKWISRKNHKLIKNSITCNLSSDILIWNIMFVSRELSACFSVECNPTLFECQGNAATLAAVENDEKSEVIHL